jgi:hypothetical protein
MPPFFWLDDLLYRQQSITVRSPFRLASHTGQNMNTVGSADPMHGCVLFRPCQQREAVSCLAGSALTGGPDDSKTARASNIIQSTRGMIH